MTCRHAPGDPACGAFGRQQAARRVRELETLVETRQKQIEALTPDSERYEIDQVERVGRHLVLRVKYPNCARCAYEGSKVMVFLNVSERDVLMWRRIDPHFREHGPLQRGEAPSPAARFPASAEGWQDALAYARGKTSGA